VLPVAIDDVCSAYNIATFITLDPVYEHMLGSTQEEVDNLMDVVYRDYGIDPSTRNQVDEVIKNMYNRSHFVKTSTPAVYNSNQSQIISLIKTFEQIWILWLFSFKTWLTSRLTFSCRAVPNLLFPVPVSEVTDQEKKKILP